MLRGVVFLEPDNSSIMRWTLSAEPNFRLNFTVLCSVEWSIVYQLDCGNYENKWRIQNFLDGKTPTLKRRQPIIFSFFLENYMKLKKKTNGMRGDGACIPSASPLDQPMRSAEIELFFWNLINELSWGVVKIKQES